MPHIDPAILSTWLAAVGLAFLDWIVGAVLALKQRRFSLQLLDRQLITTILPKLGALAILGLGQAETSKELNALLAGIVGIGGFAAATAAYAAATLAALKAKLAAFGDARPIDSMPSVTKADATDLAIDPTVEPEPLS